MAKERDHSDSEDKPTQDSMDQVKMWRAQENTRALYQVIARPYNEPKYLKWIISQTFSSTTDLTKYLNKIDRYCTGRDIPVPHAPGQYFTDPYQDPEFIVELQNSLLKEWVELSKEFDATSRVAMRDYLVSGWKFPYEILHPNFFIAWAGEGRLLLLTGEKDSGKSDWSCTLAGIAIANGYRVLGNIEMKYDVDGYIYCRLFSNMVRQICNSKLQGVPSIVIIDEAGLDFPSYEAATKEAKEFDKFAKLTRKFKTNQVFIIQYEHQIPWTLRKHHAAWNHKYSSKVDMRYEIKVGKYKGFDQVITKVPPTALPYETEHIAGMKIDIMVRDMLDFLEQLPERANQFEELMKFIDRGKATSENQFTLNEKKFLAWRLFKLTGDKPDIPKLSQKDIAQVLGISKKNVARYIEEQELACRKVA